MGAGAAAAVGGVAALGTAAIQSYADYEQLVGGVNTLFADTELSLEEYAASIGKTAEEAFDEWGKMTAGARIVQNNAEEAYKNAGMSANEYMETVTSFSASLISSLKGDTAEAAKVADMAIVDMSDNANKMGSDISSIQNAYQGFAKQNYTMLDNLKLGYGGTKSEMERLLKDAEKFSGVKYDISNLSDVYKAIHVIQEEMGISGATAKEASTTISGSFGMVKASWANLLTGIADDEADFDTLIENFVDSISVAAENLLPRVEVALYGAGNLVEQLLPVIVNRIPQIINEVLPQLLQSGINMLSAIITGIQENMTAIIDGGMEIVDVLVNAFITMLPQLIELGMQVITALITGITEHLPELTPVIINMILLIVEVLINNAPMLLTAGLELIMTLAGALLTYAPELLAKVPQLLTLLKNKFLELLSGFSEIGSAIVDGIWSGISAGWSWLIGKAKELAGNLFRAAKDELDVNSPSKKFEWLAKMCVAGWDKGAEGLMSTDLFTRNMNANLSTLQMNASGARMGGSIAGYGSFYQTVNVNQPVSTPDEMARAMRLEMRYGLMKGVPVGT